MLTELHNYGAETDNNIPVNIYLVIFSDLHQGFNVIQCRDTSNKCFKNLVNKILKSLFKLIKIHLFPAVVLIRFNTGSIFKSNLFK